MEDKQNRVQRDEYGHINFDVVVVWGDVNVTMSVTVIDPTVDVADLMRKIENGYTDITGYDGGSDGNITETDENGRIYVVAKWMRQDREGHHSDVNFYGEFGDLAADGLIVEDFANA